VKVNKREVTK